MDRGTETVFTLHIRELLPEDFTSYFCLHTLKSVPTVVKSQTIAFPWGSCRALLPHVHLLGAALIETDGHRQDKSRKAQLQYTKHRLH